MLSNKEKEFIKINCKNLTLKQISKKLKIDTKTIANYCHYNSLRYKAGRLVEEDFNYILNNYKKLTIEELAKNLDTKKQNIERILRKKGLLKKTTPCTNPNKLTPTEQKIFNLICNDGICNRAELAEKMIIAKCSIITHLNNIYSKTDCHNMAQLIFKYYNKKLDGVLR